MRFRELQRSIGKASQKVLTSNLRAMEESGIVRREVYPVVPPKTEYSLTELGQTLVPLIKGMCDWGDAYFELAGVPAPCEGVNPYA